MFSQSPIPDAIFVPNPDADIDIDMQTQLDALNLQGKQNSVLQEKWYQQQVALMQQLSEIGQLQKQALSQKRFSRIWLRRQEEAALLVQIKQNNQVIEKWVLEHQASVTMMEEKLLSTLHTRKNDVFSLECLMRTMAYHHVSIELKAEIFWEYVLRTVQKPAEQCCYTPSVTPLTTGYPQPLYQTPECSGLAVYQAAGQCYTPSVTPLTTGYPQPLYQTPECSGLAVYQPAGQCYTPPVTPLTTACPQPLRWMPAKGHPQPVRWMPAYVGSTRSQAPEDNLEQEEIDQQNVQPPLKKFRS